MLPILLLIQCACLRVDEKKKWKNEWMKKNHSRDLSTSRMDLIPTAEALNCAARVHRKRDEKNSYFFSLLLRSTLCRMSALAFSPGMTLWLGGTFSLFVFSWLASPCTLLLGHIYIVGMNRTCSSQLLQRSLKNAKQSHNLTHTITIAQLQTWELEKNRREEREREKKRKKPSYFTIHSSFYFLPFVRTGGRGEREGERGKKIGKRLRYRRFWRQCLRYHPPSPKVQTRYDHASCERR